MKTIRFFILICITFISGAVSAQSQKELGQLMREREEYYFTLSVNDPAEIQTINSICSVDGTDGRIVVCYANQQQYDKLLLTGYQPTLQTPPSMRANVTMWDGNGTYNWDAYLTYPQYVSMMEGFPSVAASGRTCTLLDLGTLSTSNHRKLLGVRINNGSPEGKPKFLYTSTIHGDEITGMILMLRLIDELCTSTDSRIVNLVNNLDIYILPLTNPDGTYNSGNNTVNGAKRYNGNNKDLNRNYKDYYQGDHPDGNSYQDETLWTMALGNENLFTMSANYHGGAEVMNYPWDAVYDDHADKDWYEYVCTEYVQVARQTYSSYMSDTYSDGVTNGATWYVITGSRQDYMNAYAQCREVTVECSTTKTPDASQLPNFWNYNHNSMLAFMEQCLNGVHGVVYDAATNQPIEGVTVTVLNHDNNNSKVSTHMAGDFHRPIKGGTYTFKFSKSGYANETVNVTVADGQSQHLTVYLTPGSSPVEMNCYEAIMPSAGDYVMGYLDGTSLVMPSHNSSSTMTTTAANVTPTDNGFSVDEETTLPQVTLTAYGNNGQYYIKYNNRYLARSSYGSSLTWGTSTSQNGRWYINSSGIYITRNNTNYYLYYDTSSNSFKLSTTSQNNIAFYEESDCPTQEQAITQICAFGSGWNWWTPNVDLDGTELLSLLENGLGTHGIKIIAQDGTTATNSTYGWSGTLNTLEMGKLYMIQASAACTFSIEGPAANLTGHSITLYPGNNWIGFFGTQPMPVSTALSGLTATIGDVIIAQDGSSTTYSTYGWGGSLTSLVPGEAYIYNSKATGSTTFSYSSNSK